MEINKVIFGDDVLVDLTSDTATADKVASGCLFHLASGVQAEGTASYTYNSTTRELTVPSWAATFE